MRDFAFYQLTDRRGRVLRTEARIVDIVGRRDRREQYTYMQTIGWTERINKTHLQGRCPCCGLFTLWFPRLRTVANRREQ